MTSPFALTLSLLRRPSGETGITCALMYLVSRKFIGSVIFALIENQPDRKTKGNASWRRTNLRAIKNPRPKGVVLGSGLYKRLKMLPCK